MTGWHEGGDVFKNLYIYKYLLTNVKSCFGFLSDRISLIWKLKEKLLIVKLISVLTVLFLSNLEMSFINQEKVVKFNIILNET